jgi:hypothetical protein
MDGISFVLHFVWEIAAVVYSMEVLPFLLDSEYCSSRKHRLQLE